MHVKNSQINCLLEPKRYELNLNFLSNNTFLSLTRFGAILISTMETIDKYVIFCAERNIFIFDTESYTHTITKIPQIARKQKNTSQNENNCTINDNKDEGCCSNYLTTISKRFFAVSTVSDKFLFIYEFNDGLLRVISMHQLARSPSSIKFTSDSESVLVADKSGDCYIYECGSETEGRWILGHCSMVLDILMSKCSR